MKYHKKKRKKMPKTVTYILLTLAALVTVGLIALIALSYAGISMAQIEGRAYKGDHISIGMTVDAGGASLPLSGLTVACDHEGASQEASFENGVIKTKGGEKGMYSFSFILPAHTYAGQTDDLTVKLDYVNANDWYIADIDVTASIESTGTVNLSAVCRYNDGTRQTYQDTSTTGEGLIYFYFGS